MINVVLSNSPLSALLVVVPVGEPGAGLHPLPVVSQLPALLLPGEHLNTIITSSCRHRSQTNIYLAQAPNSVQCFPGFPNARLEV